MFAYIYIYIHNIQCNISFAPDGSKVYIIDHFPDDEVSRIIAALFPAHRTIDDNYYEGIQLFALLGYTNTRNISTHLPILTHICASESGQHWFR